ncbi:MAG: alkaline phosphatase [Alistipes sp.]|jgi:alkaline phosphatase|nr:alkaline phosphatase [Alistipes sp.]
MKKHLILVAAALTMALAANGQQTPGARPDEVRNIILMVGDGMGSAQISALMMASDRPLNMERATMGGMVKTSSANNRVTDSAAAATAYSTGEKTANGYLGIDPDGAPLQTILEKAEAAGLATGLVATTNIQHATPAAFYAHTPDRDDYHAIALELLDSGVDVAIGGGIGYMTGREDGRDLMQELQAKGYAVADNLAAIATATSGNVVALYNEDEIPAYVSQNGDTAGATTSEGEGRDPSMLAKGTSKALEILTANGAAGVSGEGKAADGGTDGAKTASGKGFFAMVEGSWIDSAGHAGDARMLMGEMRDFDNAVGVAFDYADAHPGTLVIVVADHETGGLTIPSGDDNFLLPDSGVEFRWATGGHSATMVPILSYGTGASAFGGIMDNTEVNRRMEILLGLE